VCVAIKLPRVNIPKELISQLKDPVLKHPLKCTYINEKGADADRKSRDVYTTFWSELIDNRAEGEEFRVPSLALKWHSPWGEFY